MRTPFEDKRIKEKKKKIDVLQGHSIIEKSMGQVLDQKEVLVR